MVKSHTHRGLTLILVITLLSVQCSKSSSSAPDTGDSKEIRALVEAPSGLRIRSRPGLSSEILGLIPDGTELVILDSGGPEIEIDGVKGRWVKVPYRGVEGWVFDGFLNYPDGELPLTSRNILKEGTSPGGEYRYTLWVPAGVKLDPSLCNEGYSNDQCRISIYDKTGREIDTIPNVGFERWEGESAIVVDYLIGECAGSEEWEDRIELPSGKRSRIYSVSISNGNCGVPEGAPPQDTLMAVCWSDDCIFFLSKEGSSVVAHEPGNEGNPGNPIPSPPLGKSVELLDTPYRFQSDGKTFQFKKDKGVIEPLP